jgi:anthranilate phosphoribosyltransferase
MYDCRSQQDAYDKLMLVLSGGCSYEAACGFLAELRTVPLSEQMLAGFHAAMMDHAIPIDLEGRKTIDICGTGGDGKHTINISTLTALTVASCGYPVTKHGNAGFSSSCGSSDILTALDIPLARTPSQVKQQLAVCGITFLHAPYFHPFMKELTRIRKKLGCRTIFNILGPLCNPIQTCVSLLGVADYNTYLGYKAFYQGSAKPYAVIWDENGYDEISLTARSFVRMNHSDRILSPRDFGLPQVLPSQLLQCDCIESNKKIFVDICLGNGSKGQQNVIAANAALAMKLFSPEITLNDAVMKALDVLRSGVLMRKIEMLRGTIL